LAYLNRESGFETVRRFLAESQESGNPILMNEINIGEAYYSLYRKRGSVEANYFIDTILEGLPILRISNDFVSTIGAARIKAEYPISFADCFAVATAQHENAVLITGDPEFKQVEHLVKIEWI
jgi:ribonuclease VapC